VKVSKPLLPSTVKARIGRQILHILVLLPGLAFSVRCGGSNSEGDSWTPPDPVCQVLCSVDREFALAKDGYTFRHGLVTAVGDQAWSPFAAATLVGGPIVPGSFVDRAGDMDEQWIRPQEVHRVFVYDEAPSLTSPIYPRQYDLVYDRQGSSRTWNSARLLNFEARPADYTVGVYLGAGGYGAQRVSLTEVDYRLHACVVAGGLLFHNYQFDESQDREGWGRFWVELGSQFHSVLRDVACAGIRLDGNELGMSICAVTSDGRLSLSTATDWAWDERNRDFIWQRVSPPINLAARLPGAQGDFYAVDCVAEDTTLHVVALAANGNDWRAWYLALGPNASSTGVDILAASGTGATTTADFRARAKDIAAGIFVRDLTKAVAITN
jgi:hypothetical protein